MPDLAPAHVEAVANVLQAAIDPGFAWSGESPRRRYVTRWESTP